MQKIIKSIIVLLFVFVLLVFYNSLNRETNYSTDYLVGNKLAKINLKSFDDNGLVEVKNLKGFAIFFNLKKFNKIFFDENFFLYFEEIDLCKDLEKRGGKIYLSKKIVIDHLGASSVKRNQNYELEKNRNWHWMWSTFYYHKKHKGFIIALLIISPKIFSSLIKIVFYHNLDIY